MRRAKIFSGSSHPLLVEAICERLGTSPDNVDLKEHSNGETCVAIETSIRDQDVFIVQSGSSRTNDSLMEMLIMISACKSGSAKSITAVMPYFPYSRQSKKKSHRGAITARLVANLLSVAGIHHVITVDLHAPPTQGFFGKPVDNLHAEPRIARWIKTNVPDWKEAVVVSKNPGGTKRVTSLADALKLNFALVTTERRRTNGNENGNGSIEDSMLLDRTLDKMGVGSNLSNHKLGDMDSSLINGTGSDGSPRNSHRSSPRSAPQPNGVPSTSIPFRNLPNHREHGSSPLVQSTRLDSASPPTSRIPIQRQSINGGPARALDLEQDEEDSTEEYTDERAREVITGRLIHGHIVDDDAPSPVLSTMSSSIATLPGDVMGQPQLDGLDPMTSSFMSTVSHHNAAENALGGSIHDATAHSDDEEEGYQNPQLEHTVTLVGNVRDRTVFIIDDLMDHCGSWIAAAETVVMRGGANKVYCIATHGLFGNDSLEQMEACDCIDFIVVTNTYPIDPERVKKCKKLVILDLSLLLSEAIRRNHYGESISALFQHHQE